MTLAMDQSVRLSESLQHLIDSRLDTIDRMLLGRVGRAERLAIVREVATQIDELLSARESNDLTRDDVLAVLAQLDPPEAFLPESLEGDGRSVVRRETRFPVRATRQENRGVAKISGALGLTALSLLLFLPLSYLIAVALKSELPVLFAAAGASICMFISSVVGIAMGFYARNSGAWALVGIVTGILALLMSMLIGFGLILLL